MTTDPMEDREATHADTSANGDRPSRRRLLTVTAAILGGSIAFSLLIALFAPRLERPFTQFAGRTVNFLSNHLRGVAIVSLIAFLAVWLFIGLVSLVQWRRDRRRKPAR